MRLKELLKDEDFPGKGSGAMVIVTDAEQVTCSIVKICA